MEPIKIEMLNFDHPARMYLILCVLEIFPQLLLHIGALPTIPPIQSRRLQGSLLKRMPQGFASIEINLVTLE